MHLKEEQELKKEFGRGIGREMNSSLEGSA